MGCCFLTKCLNYFFQRGKIAQVYLISFYITSIMIKCTWTVLLQYDIDKNVSKWTHCNLLFFFIKKIVKKLITITIDHRDVLIDVTIKKKNVIT